MITLLRRLRNVALVVSAIAATSGYACSLENDPAIRFGTLENGLRYAIMRNELPAERASLRLHIAAGSLYETEAQRGIAHFLEHMAFNGGENYAPGTLVEFFQRLGMSFGGDTNAFTNFDQTVYKLDLPNASPELLEDSMDFFEDVLGGLLLLPQEIDDERGIILSEKRSRDSVASRIFESQIGFLLEGTSIPYRLPIGIDSVISEAPVEEFKRFYDSYYRPDFATLVAVGDFDVDVVEKSIRDNFSRFEARSETPAPLEIGDLVRRSGVSSFYRYESESPTTSVLICTQTPLEWENDSAEKRLSELPRTIAFRMFYRRLSKLAKEEDAVFTQAYANASHVFREVAESYLQLNCSPENWQASLELAEQELRRALDFGFLEAEMEEAVANYREGLKQAAAQADTRRSRFIADSLVATLNVEGIFAHPSDELELMSAGLDTLTLEDCQAAFQEAWSAGHRNVTVTGNAEIDSAEEVIAGVYQSSTAVAVSPPAEIEEVEWTYTEFGPKGEPGSVRYIEDLDTTLVTFENGVRLNLKPTAFEAGRARIQLRVGGGKLTQPEDQTGLAEFASSAFMLGGTEALSFDEMERVMAGHSLGFSFNVHSDAFVFQGSTSVDSLDQALQYLTAYLTAPGYRSEGAALTQKKYEQTYAQLEHSIYGPLNLEVERRLAAGDARFGMPPKKDMDKRNLAEVSEWLNPAFESDWMELAIVGDFEVDAVVEAVGKTLGALPQRRARPDYASLRQVDFPNAILDEAYVVDTEIPQGFVYLAWTATDGMDATVSRRLNLLASIFSDKLRIKVREELGGAYSPFARLNLSDAYEGFGYIITGIIVEPEVAESIRDVVREIADDLARNGVTDDELERAREPVLTSIRQSLSDNGYWLSNVLSEAQENPKALEWARDRLSDYQSITAESINTLASQYLLAEKANSVIVKPKGEEG